MMKDIDVIVQARLDSTRLPQKVILPVGEKPLIVRIVERLKLSQYIRKIIIATTEDSLSLIQDALANYPFVEYYVGSKNNVLERYYRAAKEANSQVIIRATGDNPLVCPEFMDRAIELHLETESDLTHYLGIPLGTGVEVISRNALEASYKCARLSYDLEHVTPFIYKNRDSFKVFEPISSGLYYAPDVRVTVDTLDDIKNVRKIFSHYHDKDFISMDNIIDFFSHREELESFYSLAAAV